MNTSLRKINLFIFAWGFISHGDLLAGDAGTVAGLNLLQAPNARAAAMGETFSAMNDDIAGLSYNPASLGSLSAPQASFLYHSGIIDDHSGHISFGMPTEKSAWGFSAGFYDSGPLDVNDGVQIKNVTGEKDLFATVGFARQLSGLNVGVSGKYVSSKVGEAVSASAVAADLGIQGKMMTNVLWGVAAQNLGSQMKFQDTSYDLPKLLRAGVGVPMNRTKVSALFMADAVYLLNDQKIEPGAGIEIKISGLALRAGYRSGSDLEGLTVGAGFEIKSLSLDYAFGMVDELDSHQRISVSYRFGKTDKRMAAKPATPKPVVSEYKTPVSPPTPTGSVAVDQKAWRSTPQRVYEVKKGDTLGSIAKQEYGRESMWKFIAAANRTTVSDPSNLEPGTKIILP